jgi:acetyltransferase-like isoleucine patch superfamily enzyme
MNKISSDNEVLSRETLVDQLSSGKSSYIQKYQQLTLGNTSLYYLLKYEILTSLFSHFPGALGYLLRKTFYKSLFYEMGRGTVLGSHITLRCPGQIKLGNHVYIDNNVVLDAKGSHSQITIGDSVLVGKDTVISCSSAKIIIGDDVSLGPFCHIRAGLAQVKIGSYVTIGSHTAIVSGSPSYERTDIPMKQQIGSTLGITVGDDVWIGVGVKIIDGVSIGSGSVIGAGAVVIKDIPEAAIAVGVPAKVIGYRNQKIEQNK